MATPQQISIKSVINKINRSYFIPDIQREFVWLQNPKQKKIEQLFDSLMRGYPIGAFLFWNLNKEDIEGGSREDAQQSGKLNFQLYKFIENYDVRHHHNEKIDIGNVDAGDLNIVLDGQQRLTALYMGLRGSRTLRRPYARGEGSDAYETKYLYLNLRYTPQAENPDDSYQFEFKTREEAANDKEAQWFRLSKALDFESRKDIRAYCQEQGITQDEKDVLEDFCDILNSDISYFVEHEKSLDKVLMIFIRVNSGGTKLSYSDLLMSILTATFQSDIREKMEQEVDYLAELGFGCVGRDQVLKSCLLLAGCPHVFKLENFSKANIAKVEEQWDGMINSLHDSIALISSFGYKGILTSGYIVTTLAYYLYKNHISKPSYEEREAMVFFVRIAQIRQFFSSSLDTKLTQMRDILNGASNFVDFMQRMRNTYEEFRFTEENLKWYIEKATYGNPAILPLFQIIYPNLDYATTTFHIDHIFPKSKFSDKHIPLAPDYRAKANSMFNLQLLEGSLNESKNAKDPEVWLSTVYKEEDDRREYMRRNFIPEDFVLDWENLPELDEKRSALLLEKLKKAFADYAAPTSADNPS